MEKLYFFKINISRYKRSLLSWYMRVWYEAIFWDPLLLEYHSRRVCHRKKKEYYGTSHVPAFEISALPLATLQKTNSQDYRHTIYPTWSNPLIKMPLHQSNVMRVVHLHSCMHTCKLAVLPVTTSTQSWGCQKRTSRNCPSPPFAMTIKSNFSQSKPSHAVFWSKNVDFQRIHGRHHENWLHPSFLHQRCNTPNRIIRVPAISRLLIGANLFQGRSACLIWFSIVSWMSNLRK